MKKGTAIAIITVLAIAAIGGTAYGVYASQNAAEQERYISANFQHAFSELVTGVYEMDNALQKSVLVTSPSLAGAVCTEVFAKAQVAEMSLGVLPFSSVELEKTAGYINRVGDYAYSLSQKAASGQTFTQEERENLRSLSDTATLLAQNLKAMQSDLGSGNLSMEKFKDTIRELDKSEGELLPQTVGESFKLAEEEFPEIPSLVYDGPFSEHIKDIKPRMVEGQQEIDISAGRQSVSHFLGVRPEQIYPEGEIAGTIPSYSYGTEINGAPVSVTITKQGGIVYEMLSSRFIERSELSAKEALDAAKKFLERRGYNDLVESYYIINNNVLTANFAYTQDGVVCYSDLIKIGIAMDNGSLQSFEASGYITSHYLRELPPIEVSIEDARAGVPEGINILGEQTALIPNAGKTEILCHEYKCEDANGQHYLVYVNAVTGAQEKILILLEDENGTLTI